MTNEEILAACEDASTPMETLLQEMKNNGYAINLYSHCEVGPGRTIPHVAGQTVRVTETVWTCITYWSGATPRYKNNWVTGQGLSVEVRVAVLEAVRQVIHQRAAMEAQEPLVWSGKPNV